MCSVDKRDFSEWAVLQSQSMIVQFLARKLGAHNATQHDMKTILYARRRVRSVRAAKTIRSVLENDCANTGITEAAAKPEPVTTAVPMNLGRENAIFPSRLSPYRRQGETRLGRVFLAAL